MYLFVNELLPHILNQDLCLLYVLSKVLNGLQDQIAVLYGKVDGLKESGLGFEMFLKVCSVAKLLSVCDGLLFLIRTRC